MKMKKFIAAAVTTLIASTSMSFAAPVQNETINQVALLQSLALGHFEGSITVGELKKLGDTGIGTFDGLNGEMIVLDGVVYRANAECKVNIVDDKETVPFSNVTFFDKDFAVKVNSVSTKSEFEKILNKTVAKEGENSFYMVKLNANFDEILVRSEYGQEKPYKTLVKALEKDQREATYKNIDGTIVGLYCPTFMNGLNSPGWHFHFISSDKKFGGHVLELKVNKGEVQLDKTDNFAMNLPDKKDFQTLDFNQDLREDIKKAENDNKEQLNK